MEKKIGNIGISVRLDADLYNAIKAFCEDDVRSLNFMLNQAVRSYVESRNSGGKRDE